MSNIFITGATGFLGSTLIKEILSSSKNTVYALVRKKKSIDPRKRLMSLLKDLFYPENLDAEMSARIRVCVGDITRKNFGLAKNERNGLIHDLDTIYHTAALTDLNLPLKYVRTVNVDGTRHVLDFALSCKEGGRLKKVNHISTAYVAGTTHGTFQESELEIGQKFHNTYERSKYEAEILINKYRKAKLDVDIFRPSIMVGRYSDGKTTKFKMLYQPLHIFSLELFSRVPIIANGKVSLINVDTAAKAILSISTSSNKKNMNYHIVSPENPSLSYILDIASEYFGFNKPEFIPSNAIDIRQEYSPIQMKIIEPYVPYLNGITKFDMKNVTSQLRKKRFTFPVFDKMNLDRLFNYCVRSRYIKRKNAVIR